MHPAKLEPTTIKSQLSDDEVRSIVSVLSSYH